MATKTRPLHVRPGEGRTFRARGDLFFFKVLGADNGDAFSMCEVRNSPRGGVPPHIDHHDDEAFLVLEGTYSCMCTPGESFFAPRGTPHAFKNAGDTEARILIVQAPGGVVEKYLEEAWETIEDPSNLPEPVEPDFGKVTTVAQKYGIELLPPPD